MFWNLVYWGNDPGLRVTAFYRAMRSNLEAQDLIASDERLSDLHPEQVALRGLPKDLSRLPTDLNFSEPLKAALLLRPHAPPDLHELYAFEERLIEQTLQRLVSYGPLRTRQALLASPYDFTHNEASTTIRLARREAYLRVSGTEIEEHRATLLLRINNYVDRARSGLDLRNELAGLKLLTNVLHLTQQATAQPMHEEFLDVVMTQSRSTPPKVLTNAE